MRGALTLYIQGRVQAIVAYPASRVYRDSLAGERQMKQKRAIPAFKSESEEAEWWHKKRGQTDKDLTEAVKKSKRLDQATLKARLAASKPRVVSIRLPETDLELARQAK
jgi:hypothetical protein